MNETAGENSPLGQFIQIGVVVRDIEQAMKRLTELGFGPWYSKQPPPGATSLYRGKPYSPAKSVIIRATRTGGTELEVIQPIGEGPHKEYLDEKGEGIQHIAFRVDNIDGDVKKLEKKGCTILLDGRKDGAGVAYLDLDASGIIVELVGRKN